MDLLDLTRMSWMFQGLPSLALVSTKVSFGHQKHMKITPHLLATNLLGILLGLPARMRGRLVSF